MYWSLSPQRTTFKLNFNYININVNVNVNTVCIFRIFIVFIQEEEKKIEREQMDEEASKNKRRMLGNIKFFGELFKLKVIILTILLLFMLSVLQ